MYAKTVHNPTKENRFLLLIPGLFCALGTDILFVPQLLCAVRTVVKGRSKQQLNSTKSLITTLVYCLPVPQPFPGYFAQINNSSMLSDMMQIVFRGVKPFLSSNKSATTKLTATFGVPCRQNRGTKIISLHKQVNISANNKSIGLSLLCEISACYTIQAYKRNIKKEGGFVLDITVVK